MSEASRQRRLFLQNRLEELAWKYGPPELRATPEWLESLEGWYAYTARYAAQDEAQATPASPPAQPDPPPRPPQRRPVVRPDDLGPRGPGW